MQQPAQQNKRPQTSRHSRQTSQTPATPQQAQQAPPTHRRLHLLDLLCRLLCAHVRHRLLDQPVGSLKVGVAGLWRERWVGGAGGANGRAAEHASGRAGRGPAGRQGLAFQAAHAKAAAAIAPCSCPILPPSNPLTSALCLVTRAIALRWDSLLAASSAACRSLGSARSSRGLHRKEVWGVYACVSVHVHVCGMSRGRED